VSIPCSRFSAKVWNQNGTLRTIALACAGSASIGSRSATSRSAAVTAIPCPSRTTPGDPEVFVRGLVEATFTILQSWLQLPAATAVFSRRAGSASLNSAMAAGGQAAPTWSS
jgi:hypothetical protein